MSFSLNPNLLSNSSLALKSFFINLASKSLLYLKPTFILCVPLLLENVYKKIIKTLKTSLPKKYTQDENTIIQNIPFYLKPIVKRKIKKSPVWSGRFLIRRVNYFFLVFSAISRVLRQIMMNIMVIS